MNKFFTVLVVLVLASFYGYAQEYENVYYEGGENKKPKVFYIGFGTGINSNTGGIGAALEFNPAPKKNITIIAGLGVGLWGLKNSIGIRYYNRKFPHKIFYGLNLTTASGFNQVSLNQKTGVGDETEKVTFNMHRSNNVALSMGYQVKIFGNGRLGVELGYSVPLQEKAYSPVTGSPEVDENTENTMQLLSPGGFVLGIGLTFGIK